MDCTTYRRLYPKYAKLPLDRQVCDTPEYDEHADHLNDCRSCSDWTLTRRVEQRGASIEDYPCVHIAYRATDKLDSELDDPFNDPDVIIWKFEKPEEYGIPIRDGGSSIIVIQYCPWCGVRLHGSEKASDDSS